MVVEMDVSKDEAVGSMTWNEWARGIGVEHGHTLTDEQIDYLLWPVTLDRDYIENQLVDALAAMKAKVCTCSYSGLEDCFVHSPVKEET